MKKTEAYFGSVTTLLNDKNELKEETLKFLQTVVDALVSKL